MLPTPSVMTPSRKARTGTERRAAARLERQQVRAEQELGAPSGLTRRQLIKGAVGLGALAVLPGCGSVGGGPSTDLVRRENQKPGTRDWMLKNARVDPGTKYRCP